VKIRAYPARLEDRLAMQFDVSDILFIVVILSIAVLLINSGGGGGRRKPVLVRY
jgi:hypothetical protein